MNRDLTDAAPDAAGPAAGAGDVARRHVQGTRLVLWVTSDSGLDMASLPRHLEAAHGGAAAVTLVSVEEISGSGSSGGAPANDPSDCALICQHWQQCSAGSDPRVAGGVGCSGDRADCTREALAHAPAGIALSSEPATPPRQRLGDHLGARGSSRELHLRRRREHAHRSVGRAATSLVDSVLLQRSSHATGDGSRSLPPACDGTAPLTVMVASDRRSVLDGLVQRLAGEPAIALLGEPVADPARLLMSLERWRPLLLLLDKPSFDRLTPQTVSEMAAKAPGLRVLLLCDEMSAGLVEAVLRNRFHGFLLTSCAPATTAKAIRAVNRGELWLPRTLLANAVFESLQAPAPDAELAQAVRSLDEAKDALTQREMQVVEHLRQGSTNKEIARRLGIMEDTVKKHLQSVFAKLGVHRRALVVLRPTSGRSNLP